MADPGVERGVLVLVIILWSWTILVCSICSIALIVLWCLTLPTAYRNQAATEVVAAGIALTFLAWLVLPP